jgi:hypothetical protein
VGDSGGPTETWSDKAKPRRQGSVLQNLFNPIEAATPRDNNTNLSNGLSWYLHPPTLILARAVRRTAAIYSDRKKSPPPRSISPIKYRQRAFGFSIPGRGGRTKPVEQMQFVSFPKNRKTNGSVLFPFFCL